MQTEQTTSSRRTARVVHADDRPTGRQVFKIARLLLEIAGADYPETRGAASELITSLNAQRDAIRAAERPAGSSTFEAGF